MCVFKLKNYWLKKPRSRKVNSPFLRARTECKFDKYKLYTVVIAYKNTGYKNISIIRTISPGNRFSSYSFALEEYRL